MTETIGTVSLKISRLESRLFLLKQQQLLSTTYPDLQAELVRQELTTRLQLNQLQQMRHAMAA